MAMKAVDDLADLGRIDDDGEHSHPAAAAGAGYDVKLVDLGQQSSQGFAAWKCICLPGLPLHWRTLSNDPAVVPISASERGVDLSPTFIR